MWLITFSIAVAFVCLLIIKLFQLFQPSIKKGYWKQYGISEIDVSRVVSELDILLGRKDVTERDDYIYNHLGEHEKYCGVTENPFPVVLLKDLEMVKKIYIKNFDCFVDRRQFFGAAREDSVLLKMLGNLKGDEWKGVRASVSPTFTTGKIRRMMNSINSVGTAWVKALKDSATKDGTMEPSLKVDAYKCMSNYTADVIAAAIFGLHSGTVQNPDSLFAEMTHRLTNMSPFQTAKFILSLRFPKIFRFFKIDFLDMEALRFFDNLLNEKLQARTRSYEENRNDFLQLLIEARKCDPRRGSSVEKDEEDFEKEAKVDVKKHLFLTDKVVRGQCLSFFFAGFRTTSTFLTFAMYALAIHEDVQDKLRKEVEGIFKEDGSIDYDDLGGLVYLDMVLCEVLRKFPATLRLERECVSDFHDPETGLYIPKGAFVGVPLHAIHNDKRFYENPDKFDPEHFRPDVKGERTPYAFIPFGIGPRNCIGMRFALLESKAAMAYLVHNFILKPSDNTPLTLTGKRVNFQITPPDNLQLKLIPI